MDKLYQNEPKYYFAKKKEEEEALYANDPASKLVKAKKATESRSPRCHLLCEQGLDQG